jgi:hypothetical protein
MSEDTGSRSDALEAAERDLAAVLAALEAGNAYAVLTPSIDTNWGWKPQRAEFFVDPEQATKWGQREHGVVVALPIIADYRESES